MKTNNILSTIKAELKKANITYRALAKELKISEAGVKKMFTRNDISLERAIEVCRVMNIPFAEIVAASEGAETAELRFTEKQNHFLKNNSNYFQFYMKLAYEQRTPVQIQEEFHLSAKSLNTYLKKLEEIGLIKRHPKDRAQIMGGVPLAVGTEGTALESFKFDITRDLLNSIKDSQKGSLFGAGHYLTQDEAQELKERLTDLMKVYTAISAANRRNPKSRASYSSVMILQSPKSLFSNIREA